LRASSAAGASAVTAGRKSDLELGGVGRLVVLFAVELKDGGGGGEGETVIAGR
jgi:hypothetical protein